MYICHRKRVQGYLRSSLYNYLTQTTPAKSEFSKLIGIFFCHEKCLSEGGLHIFGGGTNHDYDILFSGFRHLAFPCNSGGDPYRHDRTVISLRQRG